MNKTSCLLAAVILVGCGSSETLVSTEATREVVALDHQMTSAISTPALNQFHTARAHFATEMHALAERARSKTRSSGNTIRAVIGTAGAVIAIGGTVASLIVDDEDTRAGIAQASGGIAGVAGILSLIPFGSGTHGAKAVSTYLETELPHFESRWPSTRTEPLSAEEWRLFVRDCEHIQSTANTLGGLD